MIWPMPTFLTLHLIAFLLDKPCSGPTGSPRIQHSKHFPSSSCLHVVFPLLATLSIPHLSGYFSISTSQFQSHLSRKPQLPTSSKSPCFTASHIFPPAICHSFHCLSYLWCYFWKRQWFYSPQYLKSLEKYLVQNGLSTHLCWVSGWMNKCIILRHTRKRCQLQTGPINSWYATFGVNTEHK